MNLLILTHEEKPVHHAYSWFINYLNHTYPHVHYNILPVSSNINLIPKHDRFLVLGAKAFSELTSLTIHERFCGAPLFIRDVLGTTTYHPSEVHALDSEDSGDEYLGTRPENYRFWILRDLWKLIELPYKREKPIVHIYPRLQEAIDMVRSAKCLYLDIETDRAQELNCIGLSDGTEVFVVPVYNFKNELVYTDMAKLFVALARFKGQVVCHNALFDLFILAWRYKIPFSTRNIYDTMVAHHRIFPEVEKSLGHAIRAWTWLHYHKDEGVYEPRNQDEEYRLYEYNAKDVFGMARVHEQIMKNSTPSVEQGVTSVYPYLITMLRGMNVDEALLLSKRCKLLRRAEVLTKICRILSGIPKFNPCSSHQCADFFHNKLRYPVVRRTETGRPALGQKELYQLALKHDNPLIPVIIATREVSKAHSMLQIAPYEM